MAEEKFIYWFSDLGIQDVPMVGGKNASLGEMFANLTNKGVRVPDGFAVSAYAYNHFVESMGVKSRIEQILADLDVNDLDNLSTRGKQVRDLITGTMMPDEIVKAVIDAYNVLCDRYKVESVDVAVRSSATAEDLPDASFAGQQDTYLNVKGYEQLLESCRACFASLFTDRAIAYRQERHFDHFDVALSIAVQKMVRSDKASAGVMFSIDTESGFRNAIYVTGGYGLGENVVQGAINPDEWYVHKPSLKQGKKAIIHSLLGAKQQRMIYKVDGAGIENTPVPAEESDRFCLSEDEVLQLANWAILIEDHYSQEAGADKPMDMEWAKDGESGDLFIVQARPETVVSRREQGVIQKMTLEKTSAALVDGMAVGENIGSGQASVILTPESIKDFQKGMVLITETTDPDWVPIMKIASAIVTETGGRTSHAAIISRELGLPCLVGATGATKAIQNGQDVTVSCAQGSRGVVYEGILLYKQATIRLAELERPQLSIWMHANNPDSIFSDARYPNEGVGLLRMDELIRDVVKIHPLASLNPPSQDAKAFADATKGWEDKKKAFVDKLAQSIAHIAAAVHPKPTRVLLPDSPANELNALIGGRENARDETNPFMGARSFVRYEDFDYEDGFALEVQALAKAYTEIGMENIELVLPAVHTAKEIDAIKGLLSQNGLVATDLKIHILCRTPAQLLDINVLGTHCDGLIVHVADVAQLAMGIDATNVLAKPSLDEKHPAVLWLLEKAIESAKAMSKPLLLAHISPANLGFFSNWPKIKECDGVIVRPDLLEKAREELLQAEKT